MWIFDLFSKRKSVKSGYSEESQQTHASVMKMLEEVIGTDEKPAKVEKKRISDGSIYTGEARLLTNGFYLPHGFGKKYISPDLEMTGNWHHGNLNGVCYLNMHHSMVTGHFTDSRPNGWCLSIESERGFVFGVFKEDDCIRSLGNAVIWMVRNLDFGVKIDSRKRQILIGKIYNDHAIGFIFMNSGDVYVGTDTPSLDKNGYFFRFSHDGYIQIGRFENGNLIDPMSPEEVIEANGISSSLLSVSIDTRKKYF